MGLYTVLSPNGVCRGIQALTKIQVLTSPFCVLSSAQHRVIHNRQQRRFTVTLDDGGQEQSAVLEYSHTDGHVHLSSTQVPESFRGKGVAASLAKAALDFVVEERLKASTSCSYIKKYLEENPHHGYQAHIENS